MAVTFLLLRGKVKEGQTLTTPDGKKETALQKLIRVDWVGVTLFIGAGILILLGLNWGSNEKWNEAKVIASFCVGGLLFILFGAWEYYLERVHARPSFDEVVAVRAIRLATVRGIVDGLTDEELERVCLRNPAPGYPEEPRTVRRCLRTVMKEEVEHHRYAVRDLAVLEARA